MSSRPLFSWQRDRFDRPQGGRIPLTEAERREATKRKLAYLATLCSECGGKEYCKITCSSRRDKPIFTPAVRRGAAE